MILALKGQENLRFKTSLGYIARDYLVKRETV